MERPLYAYSYAPVAYEDALAVLGDDPRRILQPATDVAGERAREVGATISIPLGSFEVGRDVTIEVGKMRPIELLRAVVPLRWRAESHAGLFPAVDAQLEVMALSMQPPLTQVTLVGAYRPPFGWVGAAADLLAGHRVAELAVLRFVEEIASRLTELLAEAQPLIAAEGAAEAGIAS